VVEDERRRFFERDPKERARVVAGARFALCVSDEDHAHDVTAWVAGRVRVAPKKIVENDAQPRFFKGLAHGRVFDPFPDLDETAGKRTAERRKRALDDQETIAADENDVSSEERSDGKRHGQISKKAIS
jgi:hypothetical protein